MKILAATVIAANFECQEVIPMKTRSEYFEIKINITDYIYMSCTFFKFFSKMSFEKLNKFALQNTYTHNHASHSRYTPEI